MDVLIVEDRPDEAETVADIVRHHGHRPALAASAEAALEQLLTVPVDAVLLDLRLPGMQGVDLLRTLAARRVTVPVVAMSGVVTEEEARQSLQCGAVEFLPKPLTVDRLRVVLDLLELGALTRRLGEDVARLNRRRYARVAIALDVIVEQTGVGAWRGQSADLSPFGIKVRLAAEVQPDGLVRVSFQPPDGEPPLAIRSVVVRRDADGPAVGFVDLTRENFERLRRLVDAGGAGGPT